MREELPLDLGEVCWLKRRELVDIGACLDHGADERGSVAARQEVFDEICLQVRLCHEYFNEPIQCNLAPEESCGLPLLKESEVSIDAGDHFAVVDFVDKLVGAALDVVEP